MEEDLKVDKEGVYTLTKKDGALLAIIRRDPISKKHLIYLTKEATGDDMVEKIIKQDFASKLANLSNEKDSTKKKN